MKKENYRFLIFNDEVEKIKNMDVKHYGLEIQEICNGHLWLLGSLEGLEKFINDSEILEEKITSKGIYENCNKPFSRVRSC